MNTADTISDTDRNRRFLLILVTSAFWGAVPVPILAATGLALRYGVTLGRIGALLPWVLLFTVVPSVLLSVIGGVWLGMIAQRSASTVGLLLNGMIAGAVLSTPFCFLALFSAHARSGALFFVLCVGIGAVAGVGYAAVFKSVLRPCNR